MEIHALAGSSRLTGYGWEPNRVPVVDAGGRGLDVRTGTLAIEFVGGARWLYFGVPERVFEDFLLASSRGVFFHRWIRGVYEERRADEQDGLTSV